MAGASGGASVKFGSTTPQTPPSPPTPPPPVSGACALPNYPNASCTGIPAGTALTVVNGGMDINTANTVVDGKDIRGCVTVSAPGVIIRKSKISCSGGYALDGYGYTGARLLIEDSELSCNDTGGTAIGEENLTAARVNIHACENGFDVNGDLTVVDSYIHDMYQSDAAHTDGLQLTDIGHDVVIQHNTITLYCPQDGAGVNYRVIDNHFSRIFYPTVGAFFPWTDCQDEARVTGNVYHETGFPL